MEPVKRAEKDLNSFRRKLRTALITITLALTTTAAGAGLKHLASAPQRARAEATAQQMKESLSKRMSTLMSTILLIQSDLEMKESKSMSEQFNRISARAETVTKEMEMIEKEIATISKQDPDFRKKHLDSIINLRGAWAELKEEVMLADILWYAEQSVMLAEYRSKKKDTIVIKSGGKTVNHSTHLPLTPQAALTEIDMHVAYAQTMVRNSPLPKSSRSKFEKFVKRLAERWAAARSIQVRLMEAMFGAKLK